MGMIEVDWKQPGIEMYQIHCLKWRLLLLADTNTASNPRKTLLCFARCVADYGSQVDVSNYFVRKSMSTCECSMLIGRFCVLDYCRCHFARQEETAKK